MLSSATKKPNTATPDVPHELVATHILLHLPVRSLLRCRCVCKAWHDTIDDDSFIRAHLRAQSLSLVVAPLIRNNDDDDRGTSYTEDVTIAGLYRWDPMSRQPGGAATLVHAMTDYDHLFSSRKRYAHDLAHCDGLVLVPTDAKVLVLNPATRRVLALPSSPHAVRPLRLPPCAREGHQAFGFGHDPRSNTYKVGRFFYRYDDGDGYGCRYTLGTEVFTLTRDKHWRETALPPPYPIIGGRTATFFKGSLLWTAQVLLPTTDTPAGFVRFKLEDESFSVVTPPPPLRGAGLNYAASSLAELRGELCLCVPDHPRPTCTSLEMWMCTDLGTSNEPPRWDRRYIIRYAPCAGIRYLRLVAVVDEGTTVFAAGSDHLALCDCRNGEGVLRKGMVSMKDARYRNAEEDDGKHRRMLVEYIDAIPYVASLVPV